MVIVYFTIITLGERNTAYKAQRKTISYNICLCTKDICSLG